MNDAGANACIPPKPEGTTNEGVCEKLTINISGIKHMHLEYTNPAATVRRFLKQQPHAAPTPTPHAPVPSPMDDRAAPATPPRSPAHPSTSAPHCPSRPPDCAATPHGRCGGS